MAKPGVGGKFVSVNLNESYGQHSHAPSPSTYGFNRARSGSHGGGGGMVVLSRSRSSQKVGSKLSVPPPLNLPSLRKEHERFDLRGSGGGLTNSGSSGTSSRPTSSGVGWTKPGVITRQEKGGASEGPLNSESGGGESIGIEAVPVDGVTNVGGSYMPPSSRIRSVSLLSVEKAVVLRGEDFPSLKASIPGVSGAKSKQKDNLDQEAKHGMDEKPPYKLKDNSHLESSSDKQLHVRSTDDSSGGLVYETGDVSHDLRNHHLIEKTQNPEYFPGPLVRFNPRSDWADDERDTSHGFNIRVNDHENTKGNSHWDRDFGNPRESILRHNSTQNVFTRWGQNEIETGKTSHGQMPENYGNGIRNVKRGKPEVNSWRFPHVQNGRPNLQVVANSKTGGYSGPSSINQKLGYDNTTSDNSSVLAGRKDLGYGHGVRQHWHQNTESQGNSWSVRNKRYNSDQNGRCNGVTSLSGTVNAPSIIDPILDFSKKKDPFTKGEKPYHEGSYYADFDGRDPFPSGRVGMMMKKRDLPNQADLHDPVRESFEAELEKVQKLQEQERQRIIDEQERVVEHARREAEEKTRLVREQEERQKRMEEEAREAAWRSEQEHLESMQRAEEQRIAREEEKRRVAMEEERRKLAAQQKLLELEERIKKRQQVEEAKYDIVSVEKGISRAVDMGHWEAGERIVERITASASSDSSSMSRPFETGSSRPSRNGSYSRLDREKAVCLWRRDVFENRNNHCLHDRENWLHSSRQIPSFGREDVNCGGEFMANSHIDDFNQFTEQRWKLSGNGEQQYERNTQKDPIFHQNLVKKSIDSGWGQDHSRRSSYSSYPEEPYPNSEAVPPYSFNRSRYSLRQPRVLPPPLSSIHKMPVRIENQHPDSSALTDSQMKFNFPLRDESVLQTEFNSGCPNGHENSDMVDIQQKSCDSQSSLSVTSPPNSPPHLSHGDLEEFGDSSILSVVTEGKHVSVEGNEPPPLIAEAEIGNRIRTSCSISTAEDEDWTVHNNEQLQEPEEYDEDGYREEDEVHEENVDLTQRFEDLHFDRGSDSMTNNMVLGFDDGVEVGLPSDEFVPTPRKELSVFVAPQICVDTHEVQAPSVQTSIEISPKRVMEAENSIKGEVFSEPPNAPQTSTESDILGPVDLCSSTVQSTNMGFHSSSDQTVLPAPSSSSPSQARMPAKLQFGLFSGPSMSPSPLPAIQIGSIQMPLHLHPQISPSFSQVHSSQPIFQFGQLRYASPISQGVSPLAPQLGTCVHPDVPAHFALNQNPSVAYVQPVQHTSTPIHTTAESILPSRNIVLGPLDFSQEKVSEEENALPVKNHREDCIFNQQGQSENPRIGRHNSRSESESRMRNKWHGGGVEDGSKPYKQNFAMTIECASTGSKTQPLMFGNNSRKFFNVRNSGSKSSYITPETLHTGAGGFQRRQRRNIVRTEFRIRENPDMRQSSNLSGIDRGSDLSGISGYKKSSTLNKSRVIPDLCTPLEMERNISSKDIDAPLQSGIVHVFEQPGIDVPSDVDDFIEVRSKRQMLNERRERMEKESKTKSHALKMPQKPRPSPTFQNAEVSTSSSKIPSSGRVLPKNVGLADTKVSAGFSNTIVSQPLAPIGTPPVNIDSHADMRSRTSKPLQSSLGSKSFPPTSLGCWDNGRTTQQVIPLTQNQLDEAMKPAPFETCVVSIGDHSVSVTEPIMSSSSILPKDNNKTFSSSASPINSLLAGEKIQFGAVTSPTILPPSSRVVLHAIGPPPSTRSHIQMPKIPLVSSDTNQLNDSCVRLGDSDAEAEAAASAVAVAAITNDEIVTKNNGGIAANVGGGDESLSAALPADLSIETPPIPMWPPPLLNPHTSSAHIPSHFPLYDINPLLSGPIFAFGSEEAHSQSIKSGSLGPWQHHSGVDPFYGPSAGFAGPFVATPGSIPQGPPHMVVYNHFAPVGQFGQVGLSFMGTTYIPSGKQPDWNLNPHSAGATDMDLNTMNNRPPLHGNPQNTLQADRNLASCPSVLPVQQSSLPVFDMSPFQASPPDMAAQPGLPHLSMPQQFSNLPPAIKSSSGIFCDATESQFLEELGGAAKEGSSENRNAAEGSRTGDGNNDLSNRSSCLNPKKNVHGVNGGNGGGEWCYHRRMGSEKSVGSHHSKVKQVYVAKQSNGASSRGLG